MKYAERVFGHKAVDVTGVWRQLRDGELYDLYSAPKIVRVVLLKAA